MRRRRWWWAWLTGSPCSQKAAQRPLLQAHCQRPESPYSANDRWCIQGWKKDVRVWWVFFFASPVARVAVPQSRVSLLHPPASFSLASFVWRLHKRPLYLFHLCRSLARLLVFFPSLLSHFSVLLSPHQIALSSTLLHGPFAFSQAVFIPLQHALISPISFSRTILFPFISLSLSSSFPPFLSHLCQVCRDLSPLSSLFFFCPLYCGQLLVYQTLMICPLEFKVLPSLWLSCVTSTYLFPSTRPLSFLLTLMPPAAS